MHMWRNNVIQQRRLRICNEIVSDRRTARAKRKAFLEWRCLWMGVLFWREKEYRIEANR